MKEWFLDFTCLYIIRNSKYVIDKFFRIMVFLNLNIDEHATKEKDDPRERHDSVDVFNIESTDNKVRLHDTIPQGEQECRDRGY